MRYLYQLQFKGFTKKVMKTIAFSANTSWYIYNFRKNTVKFLIEKGYKVFIITGTSDKYTELLKSLGCNVITIPLNRRSINPIIEFKTLIKLFSILHKSHIDVLLNFTPKNNIYGSIAAPSRMKCINNISGLGDAFIGGGLKSRLFLFLYKFSQRKATHLFFQNAEDLKLFLDKNIIESSKTTLISGSGVDLQRFKYIEPSSLYPRRFIMVARLLAEKGVRIYAEAACILKAKYKDKIEFNLLGFIDHENTSAITQTEIDCWQSKGILNYLGSSDHVEDIVKNMDCVVLPSFYREGTPKSLIEAAALGKIIVTTNNIGCKDTVIDDVTGYLCEPKSTKSLVQMLEKVMLLDNSKMLQMCKASRQLAVNKFDERIIINKYFEEIES